MESCDLAKSEGITVFTVSAVPHGHPDEEKLRAQLVACATSADHAFVENSEPARTKESVEKSGAYLLLVRVDWKMFVKPCP